VSASRARSMSSRPLASSPVDLDDSFLVRVHLGAGGDSSGPRIPSRATRSTGGAAGPSIHGRGRSQLTEGADAPSVSQQEHPQALEAPTIEKVGTSRVPLSSNPGMRNGLVELITVCLVLGPLAACTSSTESDRPQPESSESYPTDAANSKPADLAKPYRFVLATHCGIDWAIDFDGAFWQPLSQDERAFRRGRLKALDEPSDRGTMTLISEGQAVYRSNNGPVIRYTRGETTRPDTACL
jgi:hypothetical protein